MRPTGDMYLGLTCTSRAMVKGTQIQYIIGNSSKYQHLKANSTWILTRRYPSLSDKPGAPAKFEALVFEPAESNSLEDLLQCTKCGNFWQSVVVMAMYLSGANSQLVREIVKQHPMVSTTLYNE